jgi:hypothetical protein
MKKKFIEALKFTIALIIILIIFLIFDNPSEKDHKAELHKEFKEVIFKGDTVYNPLIVNATINAVIDEHFYRKNYFIFSYTVLKGTNGTDDKIVGFGFCKHVILDIYFRRLLRGIPDKTLNKKEGISV